MARLLKSKLGEQQMVWDVEKFEPWDFLHGLGVMQFAGKRNFKRVVTYKIPFPAFSDT